MEMTIQTFKAGGITRVIAAGKEDKVPDKAKKLLTFTYREPLISDYIAAGGAVAFTEGLIAPDGRFDREAVDLVKARTMMNTIVSAWNLTDASGAPAPKTFENIDALVPAAVLSTFYYRLIGGGAMTPEEVELLKNDVSSD